MQIRRLLTVAIVAVGLMAGSETGWAQGFTFQFINQDLLPMDLGDAAWGDLNRDGRMDLLVTGLADLENPIPLGTTFINQGEVGSVDARGDSVWTQNYLPQGRGVRAAWLSDAAWVDVNHDGVLEFIIAGASSLERPYAPTTRMYRLTGSEFQEIETGLPGVYGGSLDWGDFDNDGAADLLMTGDTDDGYLTRIMRNTGSAGSVSFEDSGVRLTDVALGDGRFIDYDNDGDLDVVISGDTGAGFVTTLYRNDAGVFTEVDAGFAGLGFSAIDVADYDADGDSDLLLSGGFLSPLIVEGQSVVYRNDGNGTFTDISAALDGQFYGAAKFGDFDNDGLPDIMLSGATSLQQQRLGRVYRNEGGDQFRFAINLAGLLFSEAALGDYDYDGDIDILQIGSGVTVQYRNDQLRVNDPPTIPEGLSANGAEGGVILSWNPSTDPQTPSPGLTYNIRIGTSPGGVDIVAPMADILTGRRLISGLGNVQQNTSWAVRGLEPGTYFWSVQAIDNAFNASAWGSEGTFSITASGGVATNVETEVQPGEFRVGGGYPNPFVDRVAVSVNTPESRRIEAQVFNLLGEKVATVFEGQLPAGQRLLEWDGRDAAGVEMSAGVYLLRVSTESGSETIRLTRVRR